ncbi:MAG: type II toxin-antitoxin system RelE/ParE family toxin [Parcubacteria group bacterium]|nr:type II toxin-antitoxin system RelE/ParE family toxin [Parcubacteria group bacterium]
MQIRIFDNSLEKFIKSLEKSTIAKVLRAIDLLELFGHNLKLPHSRKITKNLFELRTRGSQEVRIFYIFRGTEIVLLHGFIKKSQKIPRKEINIAIQKMKALD